MQNRVSVNACKYSHSAMLSLQIGKGLQSLAYYGLYLHRIKNKFSYAFPTGYSYTTSI